MEDAGSRIEDAFADRAVERRLPNSDRNFFSTMGLAR